MQLNTHQRRYDYNFPNFNKPIVIGYIGLENLKFARHIVAEKVHYDLNLQIDKSKTKDQGLDVKLDELLKFLLKSEIRLNIPPIKCMEDVPFFCYRGLLTCVACTPYENQEPWKIVAILYKGKIFLCARKSEEKIQQEQNMSEKQRLCTKWGYKFEQFILSDKPDSDPNPNIPVDETEEFSLVFKNKLNNHKLIYAAEMDGLKCDQDSLPPPPSEDLGEEAVIKYLYDKEFVELKTNRYLEFPNQEKNFRRFKTKKWWCQSYLVGIGSILCGFRNDDGIVEETRIYPVSHLPEMSKKFWKSNVCLNFLNEFLSYVKRCLSREVSRKHGERALKNVAKLPLLDLQFEWTPGMPVTVSTDYVYEDDPILPQWFIENYGKTVNYAAM